MKNASKGFSQKYWDDNYSDPQEMDGIGNVNAHVRYIKNMFDIEQIKLLSVADLGFGLGFFLAKYMEVFKPLKTIGIEPSTYAYNLGKEKILDVFDSKIKSKKKLDERHATIELSELDLLSWCQNYDENIHGVIDLGICTSVFQYLADNDIRQIIPLLAKKFRYIYLSVPTDIELKRQVSEVDFKDEYAIARSKAYYIKALSESFTFSSQRLLESKIYYNEKNTPFTDLLFRF